MKTIILFFTALLMVSFVTLGDSQNHPTKDTTVVAKKLDSCFFNGKKLYGKIQLVEFANQADIKVQIVSSFPDLKVQFVENFADQCGEWQIVEFANQADLKVYIAESFPDIKIQPVVSFPGVVK